MQDSMVFIQCNKRLNRYCIVGDFSTYDCYLTSALDVKEHEYY